MVFKNSGKENTDETLGLAIEASKNRLIKHIVVASCSGETALKLKLKCNDINIVCVTHANGFEKPGQNEMTDDARTELQQSGIIVLTTTHVLSGAERGLSNRFGGIYPIEIMAHTLRMLGQGVKVGVEIAVMALDAGLIPYNEPIIAIGGAAEGADTAIIITPAHASRILETEIHEIICKPYKI
ncbi:pyruvate kinase alpha/beta domain-containing protein [Serpentinicella alkaliphila]|uniref:Pyruvate kinase C-terminal domain-containing protein n=1 Tax=Serpentinicella alkaliphila TaxID=1734049 RepID=A0A4R2U309_9FIRM|nr:pyruvate kinase alpha/beta domain-containing protein [Serpentinicella alkaliphila]QUH25938.1 hypothetical protein HZR23_09460 [Serpentinicella alkaliphila]TCQ02043.1 hypothetical protein EDD79_101916 [Serpentinicella alkaliphila]